MGDFLFFVWWWVMVPLLALVFGIALILGSVAGIALVGLFGIVAFALYAVASSHEGETPMSYFVLPFAGCITGVVLAAAGRTVAIVVAISLAIAAPIVLPIYIAWRSARGGWDNGEQDDAPNGTHTSRSD